MSSVKLLRAMSTVCSVPLVMMMHLGVSTGRYNGATTRRPLDYKAAFEEMRRHNEENQI